MATAKKVPAEYEVVLTLTHEEAETLLDLTYRIGGLPQNPPRKHTDAILSALKALGIDRAAHVPGFCSYIYLEEK